MATPLPNSPAVTPASPKRSAAPSRDKSATSSVETRRVNARLIDDAFDSYDPHNRVCLDTPWDNPSPVDAAINNLNRITYAIAAAVLAVGLIAWLLP